MFVTFAGSIDSFDIDSRYAVTAFVKYLDGGDYSVTDITSATITESGAFSNSDIPEGNYLPQLGFEIAGRNANPDTDWGNMTISNLSGSYVPYTANAIPNAEFNNDISSRQR